MKKTLIKSLALAAVGSLFVAGSAMARPYQAASASTHGNDYAAGNPLYSWVDTAYWTHTDFTTGSTDVDGNSIFDIELEQASYESDFGLYSVNDVTNPTSITSTFEVFGYNDGASTFKKHVTFWDDAGTTKVSTGYTNDVSTTSWTTFDDNFGFYYAVHTGGSTDISADYTFYSDQSFNTEDKGYDHIDILYGGADHAAYIFLEDQSVARKGNGVDWDWSDMTVSVDDVAPVPEPATMLLLGTGLAGLAGAARRRKKAEK